MCIFKKKSEFIADIFVHAFCVEKARNPWSNCPALQLFKSTVKPGQYGRFTVQLGQESMMRKQLLQGRTHFGRAYQQ